MKESELKLDDALDELDTTRNEVARLSGTETLLNDRYAMLKGENETNQDKIRSLNVELNALREEIQSLRGIANDMKFEVARKEEQADSFNLLNSQLKRQLEELERANQDLMLSENAMKENFQC